MNLAMLLLYMQPAPRLPPALLLARLIASLVISSHQEPLRHHRKCRIDELLVDMVREAIEGLPAKARKVDADVVEATKRAVRRGVRGEYGKRPLTTVHVVRA